MTLRLFVMVFIMSLFPKIGFGDLPVLEGLSDNEMLEILRDKGPWDFTKQENEIILNHLKDALAEYRTDFSRPVNVYDALLMRFGDCEHMEAVIDHYFHRSGVRGRWAGRRHIGTVGHPKMIAKLAVRLEAQEPEYEQRFEDWALYVPSEPYLSAEIFLGNVMFCGYLSESVREWARTSLRASKGSLLMPEVLPDIKRFWQENEEAIRSGVVEDVRPPSTYTN